MTWLLFAFTLGLAIWSLRSRTADLFAALLIAVMLIFASGLRKDGYDYDNYENVIYLLRSRASSDVELLDRLIIGKDPIFIWVVDFVTLFTDTATWPVFLAMAFLAVVTKLIVAISLPRYSAIFIAIYLIFLSPTLEFSGIRSAAAIGFFMVCVAYPLRLVLRLPLLILSVATHLSLIFTAWMSLVPHFARGRLALAGMTIVTAIVSFFSAGILNQLGRGQIFIGNTGTIFAPLFPIITAFIFTAQLFVTDPRKDKIYFIIAATLGLAIGLVLPSVAVAIRTLEYVWCLMLFAMVKDLAYCSLRNNRLSKIFVISCFIAMTTLYQMYSSNWLAFTII